MILMPTMSMLNISYGIFFTVLLLSIVLKIAPGEPEWEQKSFVQAEDELVRFVGGDGSTMLAGRLFPTKEGNGSASPNTTPAAPVIILVNGLGLSQDCSLGQYVDAFTTAGFAAFTFDYATFGASEGYPRHQVKPKKHIADIHAAIGMLKNRHNELNVDASNLAIWGTSLGGGHALVVASQDTSVRAVVAQIPAVKSGMEAVLGTMHRNPREASLGICKLSGAMMKWIFTSAVLGRTTYVPLHGPPGSAALMQNPGDDEGYASLIPHNGGVYKWRNLATVGSAVGVLTYRPINSISTITSPTLMIAADQDTLCPAANIQEAAHLIDGAEVLILSGAGHFDVYEGKLLDSALAATVGFFQKHMMVPQ